MDQRKPRFAGWWGVLLAFVLLALALHPGATIVTGQSRRRPLVAAAPSQQPPGQARQAVARVDGEAGAFPDFIAVPDGSVRGVAVDKTGNVYISVLIGNSAIEVRKFTPGGAPVWSVNVGQGNIGGLMVTPPGELYIALAAGANRGVWRMNRDGQELELVPGSDQIFFANGLVFDDVGTLWVTESTQKPIALGSGQGAIWRVMRGGSAELCLRDDLLTGTGALKNPVMLGANGIAYYHGYLYITNTEKETVLRMPVWPDGSFGKLEPWMTLEDVKGSPLYKAPLPVGGDGIALDVYGNLYIAVVTRSAIVRVSLADKKQQTVAVFKGVSPVGPPPDARLDFPASLFFGTGKGERTNLFVTNSGQGKTLPSPANQLPWVGSGLVKIDAGVPGRPQ
ncbi:MAG: SMP-30/gluconolactonase/LRE family protein [Bacteroidales bacterium]